MKYFVTFITLFLTPSLIQGQSFVFEYDISYSRDTNNIEHVLYETGYLFAKSNQLTIYSTENFLKRDTLFEAIDKGEVSRYEVISNPANLHITYFPYFVLNDLQKGITEIYEVIDLDCYYYEVTRKLDWHIEEDQKDTINNFSCSMASTTFAGREFVAWFTPEIPISCGPHTFSGLPGLVVKLYDTKGHYNFTLKSVKTFEGDIKRIPFMGKKAIESEHKTVFSIREKARVNPLGSLESRFGFDFSSNAEFKSKVKANAASKNNPLELRVD